MFLVFFLLTVSANLISMQAYINKNSIGYCPIDVIFIQKCLAKYFTSKAGFTLRMHAACVHP